MKKLIRHTKMQFYLMVRLPYFWISLSLVVLYFIANIVYYGFSYYGYSATGIVTASDLYILSSDNRFWGIFSILIPFICMLPFGMQPLNDRERKTGIYMTDRQNSKLYYMSGMLCSALGTFLIMFVNMLICTVLLYIMFDENGNTLQGSKYSVEYWLNIQSGYCYHFQNLHIKYPVIYIIVITFIFSLFCSVIAVFMYAAAVLIKKDRLIILLAAGAVSFAISQIYLAFGYDIYGDVTSSAAGRQTGILTFFTAAAMLAASFIIIFKQIKKDAV